jgi:phospholipase/carboxylesterase
MLLSRPPILLGFSNGAIMASSILLQRPNLVAGAVLIRPLSPAPQATYPQLTGKRILILAGKHDPRRVPQDAVRVREQFEASGAEVRAYVLPTGHGLHETEPALIRDWLQVAATPSSVRRQG